MESHLPRTHGHHYEQDPLDPAGSHPSGEDENHHEKKSVLKKVKTKATKIKNTLTKHGHAHDHHHEHEHEHEHVEDEEMVEDPEIHGAPIYESVVVMSGVVGTEGIVGKPGFNLERPSVMAEDRYDSKMTELPVRSFGQWQEGELGQPEGNLGRLMPKEEGHNLPEFSDNYGTGIRSPTGKNLYGGDESLGPGSYTESLTGMGGIGGSTRKNIVGQEEHLGGEGGLIGMSTRMEEDPHGPNYRGVSSNVQAKTIDATGRGSEEAEGITPILHSFEKMGIHDNPESKPKAEPLRHENPDSYPKIYDASRPQDLIAGRPQDLIAGRPQDLTTSRPQNLTSDTSSGNLSNQSTTCMEKITSAASADVDTTKARSATQTATDYAHRIAGTVTDTLAPMCSKVVGAGSDVLSKVKGSGTGHERGESEAQDRGISVTSYWTEKLKPGEEDKVLSEVITGTFIKPNAEIEKKIELDVPSGGGQGVSGMISDAVQERELATSGGREPTGILKEAKEGDSGGAVNVGGGPVGVLDKIKGVVGSWVGGKGGETTETNDAGDNEEIMVKDGRIVGNKWKSGGVE